jgi:hypothetical protein
MSQIMIDTNTDSPAHILAIAQMLVAQFETVPVPAQEANPPTIEQREAGQVKDADLIAAIVKTTAHIDLTPVPSPPAPPAALGPIPLPPGVAVERDSAGVPYDATVHSSTRSKTIDGKWKARRNRTSAAAPAAPETVAPPAVPIPPPPVSALPPLPPPVTAAPLPPNAPPGFLPADDEDEDDTGGAAGLPSGPNAGAVMDFPTFITLLTARMSTGAIPQDKINEVMRTFGLDSLFALNSKPEKVADVARAFGLVAP